MMRVEIYKGEKKVGAVDQMPQNRGYKAFSCRDPKNPKIKNFADFIEACRWVWAMAE